MNSSKFVRPIYILQNSDHNRKSLISRGKHLYSKGKDHTKRLFEVWDEVDHQVNTQRQSTI